MSAPGRRKNIAVIDRLVESAFDYTFVQAVRLIERTRHKETGRPGPACNPVGGFTPPLTEAVRFTLNQTLAFPASEVESLQSLVDEDGVARWRLLINIIGLTGSTGVLPYHYTELIFDRHRHKDENLEHFFDLFNHRIASLYYKASIKYRLPLQYERNRLFRRQTNRHCQHTEVLLSLIGLGNEGLQNRLFIGDESLIYFGGLFNQKIRTSTNLRQILRSHFHIPVEINQFIGQWCEMIDDVRTRLAEIDNPRGCNARLGRSAILGKRGWFSQGKIQIVLGPLDKRQLEKFAPGSRSLIALDELVRLYLGMENDYEFVVRVDSKNLPHKTCMDSNNPPIIGWNTFLRGKPGQSTGARETLDISISASRLQ